MHPGIRNEVVAFVGEFCGTFLFLFSSLTALQTALDRNSAALDVIANEPDGALAAAATAARPDISTLLYVSMAFGFSLMVNCWIFYRVSGGMFNPAVSFALFLAGAITPVRLAVVFPAQLIASIASSWLLEALLPGDLTVGSGLPDSVSAVRGMFIEMMLTLQLVMTILMLAVEKHKASYIAPIGIGLALFLAHLSGVYFSSASLNPVRSFGPATIQGFPTYHWIYWVGPFVGATLATAIWKLLTLMDFETSNPGQDFDELESSMFNPPKPASGKEDVKRPIVNGWKQDTKEAGSGTVGTP